MASINAQSAKFIGNDFIIPKRVKQNVEPEPQVKQAIAVPVRTEHISYESVRPFAVAVPAKASRLHSIVEAIKVRPKLATLAILVVIAVFAAPTIARATIWQAIGSKASTLVKDATNKLHIPAAAAFTMPAYSKLVKTGGLTNDLSYVELQPITISLGSMSVTSQPADIAKWVKSTAGPQAGTTVLSVNTAALSSYVNGVAKNNYDNDGGSTISASSISAGVKKIANELFSCNGVNINLLTPSSGS
jgi:hypothetical protein